MGGCVSASIGANACQTGHQNRLYPHFHGISDFRRGRARSSAVKINIGGDVGIDVSNLPACDRAFDSGRAAGCAFR